MRSLGHRSEARHHGPACSYHVAVHRTDPAADMAVASTAAVVLTERLGAAADTAVVLGTGLGPVADAMGEVRADVDLAELPGFGTFRAPGHQPRARLVAVDDRCVLLLLGRIHLYEGRRPGEVAHAVRTAVLAGCRTVVLTNAAGALDPALDVGQPVLIADHLDLTGTPSALTGIVTGTPGTPDGSGGAAPGTATSHGGQPAGARPGFVEMTDTWSARLRAVAQRCRPAMSSGVYAQMRGPQFESPAEIRMLRALGADLVGMSTVVEAVAARHLGAELLGISVVTNVAAGLGEGPVPVEEIMAVGAAAGPRLGRLLADVVRAC